MQFSDLDLDPRLQRAIQALGYTTPTPIQAAAIPNALAGRDLIGTASTGTGKTIAFVLPMLNRLLATPPRARGHRALIVTPTRELAEQILTCIRDLTRFAPLRSASIYGGVGFGTQMRALKEGVEILVTCPGRLLDHVERGTARLNLVECLVLDEADRMLDMGFLPAVRRILKELPESRQTLFFSATFAPELEKLAGQCLHNPERVDVGVGKAAHTVAHALYPVNSEDKTALLMELLDQTRAQSTLIFTRTKHRADRLVRSLHQDGYPVAVLHAGRSQSQRTSALDGFRSGRFQILVATDIAARGLDISTISHVINFDIPDTVDAYIHRVGRTGRAEREGDALTLVTSEDVALVRQIEKALGARIDRKSVPGLTTTLAETAPAAPTRSRQGRPRSQGRGAAVPAQRGGRSQAQARRA